MESAFVVIVIKRSNQILEKRGMGQDILETLVSYSRDHAQKLTILSAVGGVSSVSLINASDPKTHRGFFDIASLQGFVIPAGMDGRCDHVTIIFSGPNNVALGGRACSPLIAATPVFIVLLAEPQESSSGSGSSSVTSEDVSSDQNSDEQDASSSGNSTP